MDLPLAITAYHSRGTTGINYWIWLMDTALSRSFFMGTNRGTNQPLTSTTGPQQILLQQTNPSLPLTQVNYLFAGATKTQTLCADRT